MRQLKRKVVREVAPEWEVGFDGMLRCPCGRRVEDDGSCPDGHVSPLREHGMI